LECSPKGYLQEIQSPLKWAFLKQPDSCFTRMTGLKGEKGEKGEKFQRLCFYIIIKALTTVI
jgi:hypothetical protein